MIDWQAIYEKHMDDVPPDDTLECDECGHHIEPGEAYYKFDDWIYCKDCVIEHYKIRS